MKPVFGIFCLLEAASAGLLINENSPFPLASCDILKNDTQRAILFQDFFEKADKNNDQSISSEELEDLGFEDSIYQMREFDLDKNQEINGQEICGLLKSMWELFKGWEDNERHIERERQKTLDDPSSRLTYESFSNNLVSITKDEFINWTTVAWKKHYGEASLIGEFLFLFADNDMSGELTHEENYLTFAFFKYFDSLPPFSFSKTANPKWSPGLASCNLFKNDTQRAVLIQKFTDKVDKNGDGSLSAKELSVFGPIQLSQHTNLFSKCYDDDYMYQETGRENCYLIYEARKSDKDKNNQISGQEMCAFWKAVADALAYRIEYLKENSMRLEEKWNISYEKFSKNHPELFSMTKDEFIDWVNNEVDKVDEDYDNNLLGEFYFIFLDKDMSGVLDSYEEIYFVFAMFLR